MTVFLHILLVVLLLAAAEGDPRTGFGSPSEMKHQFTQKTLEIDWVSGCDRDSSPRKTTSQCPVTGGTKITVRGRVFLSPITVLLIDSKNRQDVVVCENVEHSPILPSLIFYCRIPVGDKGQKRHLRIASRSGSAILRHAIEYETDKQLHALLREEVDWNNYLELGIGGLHEQFREIFRRVFVTRVPSVSAIAHKLGVRPVRGLILYGPSGTGKTLMAKKIAEMLDAKHVQLISGPEIVSKYVGESEKNLRGLFAKAESDFARNKGSSALHVIVIDEIDSIMKPRGAGDDSGSRAVYDGVTTQMLAFMDGLRTNSNILVIGLTNRLESLDKALLRPGRFEVQLRIPLPDEDARRQILEIHTKKLRQLKYLSPDFSIHEFTQATSSLSGADIEGIVNSAVSLALERIHGADQMQKFEVMPADMRRGLQDVLTTKSSLANTVQYLQRGIVAYSVDMRDTIEYLDAFTSAIKSSSCLHFSRLVLFGKPETGTSTIAAMACHRSRFSFVSVVSPESFIGLSTEEKLKRILSVFESASSVTDACIVLDSVENLIEFDPVHSRMNAAIVHDLSMLLSKPTFSGQKVGSKVLVIMASSVPEALKLLRPSGFDGTRQLWPLSRSDAFRVLEEYRVFEDRTSTLTATTRLPLSIGVKRLMYLIDAASARTPGMKRKQPTHNVIDDAAVPSLSEEGETEIFLSLDCWFQTLKDHGAYSEHFAGTSSFDASSMQA